MGDKEEILITEQDHEQLKNQAADFLKSGYFFAAQQFYKQLLEEEPDNKDFRIACLMAQNNVRDEEALVKHFQDLYSAEEYEAKPALEKEDTHIEEVVERSYIPDYLEKDEIRKVYDYDLTYQSLLACRERQKEQIVKLINHDENLSWMKQKGFSEINEILKVYDQRIDQAENDDRFNAEKKKNEYQRFLYQAYAKVKELSKKAKAQKDSDYKALIKEYEETRNKDELRDLIFRFEHFKDYKQAKRYISLCESKIDDLKKQENDEILKNSVSTIEWE